MKPVVIIAIAVGCSIAGTLGVLIAWQGVATMQAQEAYNEIQNYQNEMDRVATELNLKVCSETYNSKECRENGALYSYELRKSNCNIMFDYEISQMKCDWENTVKYYKSLIPAVESLTDEQREYFGYTEEDLIKAYSDMTFAEQSLEIFYEQERKMAEEEAVIQAKFSEPCSRYEEAQRAYRAMMEEYQAQISAGQISHKDLDRLEADAKAVTGYYDGMSNYMMTHC